MTRIITVRCCTDCPHIWFSNTPAGPSCYVMDFKSIVDVMDTPAWCPLPTRKDYLLQENVKEIKREHRAEKRRKAKLAAEQKAFEKEEI